MGILISRFRKKKPALETLEKLENEIKELEKCKYYAQSKQRRISYFIYSICLGLCIVCGIMSYMQFSSKNFKISISIVLVFLSPFLLWLFNKLFTWYYIRIINKNQSKLQQKREEKKKILNEVMDKETYKVAKEILDKFSQETAPKPILKANVVPNPGVRKRQVNQSHNAQGQPGPNNMRHPMQPYKAVVRDAVNPQALGVPGRPMLNLPAPVPNLNRSYIDKVFEYLIGDGPNNRYALICSRCHSHNGMALKEEFEYVSFKCCYCFFYNAARKNRPDAPKLEDLSLTNTDEEPRSSSDESESGGRPRHQKTDLNGRPDKSNNLDSTATNSDADTGDPVVGQTQGNEEDEASERPSPEPDADEDTVVEESGANLTTTTTPEPQQRDDDDSAETRHEPVEGDDTDQATS